MDDFPGFPKYALRFAQFLLGMNAVAACVIGMSYVFGFGTAEQRVDWIVSLLLSLGVATTLLIVARQAGGGTERLTRPDAPSDDDATGPR